LLFWVSGLDMWSCLKTVVLEKNVAVHVCDVFICRSLILTVYCTDCNFWGGSLHLIHYRTNGLYRTVCGLLCGQYDRLKIGRYSMKLRRKLSDLLSGPPDISRCRISAPKYVENDLVIRTVSDWKSFQIKAMRNTRPDALVTCRPW